MAGRMIFRGNLANLHLPFTRMKKILLLAFLIAGFTDVNADPPGAGMAIYWIDVEGGAATLIVSPSGESILIDTGNPGGRDAERIYKVATETAGLKQIDHLIVTHFHIDHYGGAAELARKMPVIQLYDKGIPGSLPEDKAFDERIAPYRAMTVKKRNPIRPGDVLTFKAKQKGISPLTIRCVGVDRNFTPVVKTGATAAGCEHAGDKAHDASDNGNSTVYVIEYCPFRFFNGAYLTWNVEKELVCPVNLVGEVDVYQVNHHGLDQSNNPLLVKSLAPTVAVMNNGTRKGCGPETYQTLTGTASIKGYYQMHKNLREDGDRINALDSHIANLEEDCQANYLQLSVAPDGKSYTVTIPANGHSQTYQTKARK
jgi:competence protein ComEC